MRSLLYIGICALTVSCAPRVEDPTLLAQLGSEKLYLEDIADRLPSSGSMEAADSAGYVDLIITTWAKNVLLVQAAEFNLRAELQDFEDLVEQYRNDLLKHAYIDRYINQNLETTISEDEVIHCCTYRCSENERSEALVYLDASTGEVPGLGRSIRYKTKQPPGFHLGASG